MIKNAFYVTLKAPFVLIFFSHVGKRLDKFNLKIDDVAKCGTNNYNTHIYGWKN